MRLAFLGTPAFAVPTLRLLAGSPHPVALVVTNPDRRQGRGRQPAWPPVKVAAVELGLPVVQPDSVHTADLAQQLQEADVDLFVVVAFSILPRTLLAIPRHGSVNLHPSLLPKYRGAAPIIWAVVRGETETGVSTFLLNPRVDTGDILLQRRVPIHPDETAGELEARLAGIGARLMLETIDGLEAGELHPLPQSSGQVTRAPKLSKQDGRINWNHTAHQVRNHIRGMNPVPGAFTEWRSGVLKIHRAQIVPDTEYGCCQGTGTAPGTVIEASTHAGLVVSTGKGCLRLSHVQPQGRQLMEDTCFVLGYPIARGDRFGAQAA